MSDTTLRRIPQREFNVIVDLIKAHQGIHGDKLRAVIAFGNILSNENSHDIDLLEVVKGWTGKRLAIFSSSATLPLRGALRLYFLTPEEFEDPNIIEDEADRKWTKDLLQSVRQAHDILISEPSRYVEASLFPSRPLAFLSPPTSGYIELDNPYQIQERK